MLGTSCVLTMGKGEVSLLGYLGREEGVLEVDVPV